VNELFTRLETQRGLPSGLLDSVWSAESNRGDPNWMLSSAGAQGHFQFMPATAKQYGVTDPNDLTQAATGAAHMFADLLKSTGGDIAKALAGYNWGIGNLSRKGMEAAPLETRNYIQKVTASMGQPQTDSSSAAWDALNQEFSQGAPTKQGAGAADRWAELNAEFAQPAATPKAAQALPQGEPAQGATAPGGVASTLNRGLSQMLPMAGFARAMRAGDMDINAAKGVASGFADVGNTLLNTATKGANAILGPDNAINRWNAEREAGLKGFNQANDSVSFSAGRLGANIAATAPIGSVLGGAVRSAGALPGMTRAAPVLDALGSSIASGGFRTGMAPATLSGQAANMGLRMAGGAITGGASAGLIDPSSADGGAAVGAVLPPLYRATAKGADLVSKGARAVMKPDQARAAETILEAGGYKTADEIAQVRSALGAQGPNIVAEPPTVPQILRNPQISQLRRTLRNSGETSLLERETAQNAARLDALNRVSPVTGTVQQSAENFGNALAPKVRAADEAAREQVEKAFRNVDPFNDTRFNLPIPQMQQAQQHYLGPGTFGGGKNAQAAIDAARNIGEEVIPAIPQGATGPAQAATTVLRPVTFGEAQNLRSSIGEVYADALAKGRTREAAALDQMRRDIDARVEAVSKGQSQPGEHFPHDIVAEWKKALAMHQDRMQRYRTGPQASIFRQGGDGLPAAQGAELAPKFFSPRLSQSDDIQGFKRVASPDTTSLLKNYAVTDLASQTDRLGNLTNAKYQNWTNARSGAVKGLFDEPERATLRGVGQDLARADSAQALGMAMGSNTAQNVQSALGLGLLDSPAVALLASRIPGVKHFTGPMLESLRETAKRGKVQQLSGLLSDPVALDRAIAESLSYSMRRPGLLADDPLVPLLLRQAPLLTTDR
jgi:hypothetical protein